jgi:hypothetical protein
MIEVRRRVGLAGALLLAAVAYAQEPPPPPVEAPPGPEFRMIEPRAEEVLRKMSELLARAPSFALEADEVFDEVPEHEPRRQLVGRRQLVLRRPDRLAARASGDALHRSVWYDGTTITALDEERNVYASLEVGAPIDTALDRAFERTGLAVPLADFLYANPYERLTESAERGVYLGIHEAAGVACHHLAFEAPRLDWQLWIEAGDTPLPRKLVIAYKTEEGVPQYSATIRKWTLGAAVPDALFRFEPPETATRVELPEYLHEEAKP